MITYPKRKQEAKFQINKPVRRIKKIQQKLITIMIPITKIVIVMITIKTIIIVIKTVTMVFFYIYNLHFFKQNVYSHQVLIYLNVPETPIRRPLQNRQIVEEQLDV